MAAEVMLIIIFAGLGKSNLGLCMTAKNILLYLNHSLYVHVFIFLHVLIMCVCMCVVCGCTELIIFVRQCLRVYSGFLGNYMHVYLMLKCYKKLIINFYSLLNVNLA